MSDKESKHTPILLSSSEAMIAALNETYDIRPGECDDYIYDSMPSSGVALAYFALRAAIAKAQGAA